MQYGFILSFFFICIQAGVTKAQDPGRYEIHGFIKEIKQGKCFLRYFTSQGPYLDSGNLNQGRFTIRGKMPAKNTVARLYLLRGTEKEPSSENTTLVWLEPGKIVIKTEKKLSQSEFAGSTFQYQFSELQKSLESVTRKIAGLDKEYVLAVEKKLEGKKNKLLEEEYPATSREKQTVLGKFISKYPASPISAFYFEEFSGNDRIDLGIVEPVYRLLDSSVLKDPKIKNTVARMEINRRTAPGMMALEFSQTDTSGKIITLSSFKGKFLLIDFWAGWCMPCRAENPHLRSVYQAYKDKGLELLGVSLDGERKRWTEAIRFDKLTWPQVSDLGIFDNKVAKQYGIVSIPQNLLIDREGKIIGWNFRGTSLDKKLSELIK